MVLEDSEMDFLVDKSRPSPHLALLLIVFEARLSVDLLAKNAAFFLSQTGYNPASNQSENQYQEIQQPCQKSVIYHLQELQSNYHSPILPWHELLSRHVCF